MNCSLPDALLPLGRYNQFILVQFLPSDKQPGKTDKFPINPKTFKKGDAHDPSIWLSHAEAHALAESMGHGWGVGFTITAADPFACLDIDRCLQPDGVSWSPHALELLKQFPGAVELSNSGKGLHVWGQYASVPAHSKRNAAHGIELYTEKRFIALGTQASGMMYDLTDVLPGFINQWFPARAELEADSEAWTSTSVPGYIGYADNSFGDTDLIARIQRSNSRSKDANAVFLDDPQLPTVADLWNANGDILAKRYPPDNQHDLYNRSLADSALAFHLAWLTGHNCERIDRLMKQSQLIRDKWNVDVHRTYLRDTILKATADKSKFLGANQPTPVDRVNKSIDAIIEDTAVDLLDFWKPKEIEAFARDLSHADTAKLFSRHVYLSESRTILTPHGDMLEPARFNDKYASYGFMLDHTNTRRAKSPWDAYLANQTIEFPKADGTMFDPKLPFQAVEERGGRVWVNVYKPPVVKRRPGDVAPFLHLLNTILPNGDDAQILLSYLAACVQNVGKKFTWAVFLQGTQGNGKSTFTQCLSHALGNQYIFPLKASAITNPFNSWLVNNVMFIADDIYTVKDRGDMMEELKTMITETMHSITYKGVDSISKRVCGNFLFNSNHQDAIRKTDDARRFCILYCAQQSHADKIRDGLTLEYFAALYHWLENEGGYEFVAEYLHTLPIDPRYNPAGECMTAPVTTATKDAIDVGRTVLQTELIELIDNEAPGFAGGFVSLNAMKKSQDLANVTGGKIPNSRKNALQGLGYIPHPGLTDGKTERAVMPDGVKTVLYVRHDSPLCSLTGAAVSAAYEIHQQKAKDVVMSIHAQRTFTI